VVNLSLFAASVLLKDPLPPAIISLVFGMAGFLFAWAIWRTLATEDLTQDSEWRYDVNRINELRRISVLYRTLQPVIQADSIEVPLQISCPRSGARFKRRGCLASGHRPNIWPESNCRP
jgi:hypothetical protein